MKVENFFFGNGVEVLTDNELKATRGGSGPANWAECCTCDFTVVCSDGYEYNDSGTFCASYGSSNCNQAFVQYGKILVDTYGQGTYLRLGDCS